MVFFKFSISGMAILFVLVSIVVGLSQLGLLVARVAFNILWFSSVAGSISLFVLLLSNFKDKPSKLRIL